MKSRRLREDLPDACWSCSALVAVVLILAILVLVLVLVVVLIVLVLTVLVVLLVLRHEAHLLSCVRRVFCAERECSMRKSEKKFRKNIQKGVDKAGAC